MWNSSAVWTGLELALRASFTRDRVYFFEVTGSSLYCVRMVYITKKGSCVGTFSAVRTGLEPATSGVTGRYSNQLNYRTKTFSVSIAMQR